MAVQGAFEAGGGKDGAFEGDEAEGDPQPGAARAGDPGGQDDQGGAGHHDIDHRVGGAHEGEAVGVGHGAA